MASNQVPSSVTEANSIPENEPLLSQWLEITQDMVDQFGEVTRDSDPIHNDPEWAAAHTSHKGTIAFGFQTVSLLSFFAKDAFRHASTTRSNDAGISLNYGFDRLRMVAPVPVGARIRGRFVLIEQKRDEKARLVRRYLISVEIEDRERPALVGEWLTIWVPAAP